MALDQEKLKKTLEQHMSPDQAQRVLEKLKEAFANGAKGDGLKDVYRQASTAEGITTTEANESLILNTASEEI